MGKAKSYEIIEYRKNIMSEICKNKELVKLLGMSNCEYPEDEIPFNCMYPHEFIPETISETKKFINFDIRASLDYKNKTFKNITIWVWILCHQDVVRYIENGKQNIWFDLVTCELDEMFSGENNFGVGEMVLVENEPYYPQVKFKGRRLTFKLKDYTDGLKYGR